MADLIKDTSKKMGVAEKAVFMRASMDKGFTNASEVADYRYTRWFKYGEVPTFVEEFCLTQWRAPCVSQTAPTLIGAANP